MNLDDEIRDHIERETRDNIGRGMTPDEARYAALRKFGNVARVKEDVRAVWRRAWVEQIWQDGRYALRTLRRDPMFTAVVVLTLALTLGLNTVVFSVVNSVLLRPIDSPDANRLVWIAQHDPHLSRDQVASPDFLVWRKQAHSFASLTAYGPQPGAVRTANGSVQINGVVAGGDFWKIAGSRLALGRVFSPDEQDVVMLSWHFFEREFAANPGLVGTAVLLDGRPATIVGVLAQEFHFQFPAWWATPPVVDAYLPLPRRDYQNYRSVNVVGALKPGVRIEEARTEIEVIEKRVQESGGPPRPFGKLVVDPLQGRLVGSARRGLIVLFAAGAILMLIAASNVTNLVLARTSARQREVAVRAALGAGRIRTIREFAVENMILALSGSCIGLLLSRWAIAALIRIAPGAAPRLIETTIDGRVGGFALLIGVIAAVLFSIAPMVSMWSADLHSRLKDSARSGRGPSGLRLRRMLVAGELAMAIVLLIGAGLVLKTSWRMSQWPAGFSPDHVLVFKVRPPGGMGNPEAAREFLAELITRTESTPGVRAAGISTWMLFGGMRYPGDPQGGNAHVVRINAASEGYFRALGMRMLKGRWLRDTDSNTVMLNESMAREIFGDRNPVGQVITITSPVTVVGIVADLKYAKLDAAAPPEIYIPYRQFSFFASSEVAIATAHPAALALSVRKTLAKIDPSQAAYDMQTLEQALAESIAPRRFNLFLLGSFAAVALILAIVGVYGVVAYSVAERTRDIGVRMALGAQTSGVVRMIVAEGMTVAGSGIFVGLVAAFGLTRLMTNLLYDVKPSDPTTFAAVAGALLLTALAACWGPALRAAEVDPVIALRCE